MSLQLLDGTDAAVDMTVSGNSLRCIINQMGYRVVRGFQDASVLCSGKSVSEKPGRIQHFIDVTKFASKGTAISDLSALMSASASAAVVFTLGSGITKTGAFWCDLQSDQVTAGSFAIPGNLSFRSDGDVVSVGVTS